MEVSSNVAAAAGPYADVVAIVLLLHACTFAGFVAYDDCFKHDLHNCYAPAP